MTRFERVAATLASCVALLALVGCTTELTGTVTSTSTGDPIPGATVVVSQASTTTGTDGAFTLHKIKRGEVVGHVQYAGYPDTSFRVTADGPQSQTKVQIPDSVLTVTVSENAVEPKEVADFELVLDDGEPTATATLGPLPPGTHALVVKAPGREDFETTITLEPGSNEASAVLSLTPLETYKRFFKAGRFHRDSVAYKYIHPGERKKLSLKKWKAWGAGTEDKSIKFGDVRMLKKWKSNYTKKTYKNVAEVDRTIVYQVVDSKYSDFGKTYTDNFNQHWVKVEGRWYLVHAKGPK